MIVKLLRSLKGWKQTELAEAAGTSQTLISSYELGEKVPRRRTLERLADAVGVPFLLVERMLPLLRHALAAIEDPSTERAVPTDFSSAAERIARTVTEDVQAAIASALADAAARPV
jgi:transcriptional regulator with XRE-family HTH domain